MNYIDLFCGCGGFSLGLSWAGLNELAAIDNNPYAVKVFASNFPKSTFAIQADLRSYSTNELRRIIGDQEVDIIVGGPPCQGFSTVRQRDGANSGTRLIEDQRRELYQELLRFVDDLRPKIFIMENVLGIKSAAGGHFFTRVQSEARKLGYRVHSEIVKAWEFGVPQKRERQLIFGTRLDLPVFSFSLYLEKTHNKNNNDAKESIVTLWEAIGDLPPLEAGQGSEIMEYDQVLRKSQLERYTGRYLIDVLEIDKNHLLSAHRARPHSDRDLRDFKKIFEGETGAHTLLRGVALEAPYDRSSFKDRYTKQNRNQLCSTIVAHLSKDGLMFIHPTQNRSLTPREAARIQSFPDTFQFPVSRTQQFQLIGNAVPPLVGKAVGKAISKWLEVKSVEFNEEEMNIDIAKKWFFDLTNMKSKNNFGQIPNDVLVKGWKGFLYLNFHLHPDGFLENGKEIINLTDSKDEILTQSPFQITQEIYEQSGWPVQLIPYAQEIRKRYQNGEVGKEDYYCSSILINGYFQFKGGNHG